ncbi:pyridine nucleotide-disulfide oxidoreductase [Lentzea sp. NBRC 105346]|uniref:NAD(P)/FAD-dependent oxidoreductase n=1 Tax=Lentzea sp. NBRC 105346 TaxID=3032205 RepID=UPI0024A473BD|nr:FAD-dependent oxidoreductase [Lentzea sp. NBRC 105346]GLZ32330.1 pyridine nucleotide-disulfide oxidoreductase [Lentzea sp. NBRC 105346]
MKTIAVVGASLAGLRSVQALRSQGFDGRIVVIGDEIHPPYDRPPLSKDFLLGKTDMVTLADREELAELDADWRMGVRASALRSGEIELENGGVVAADGVVIATGAVPRTIPDTLTLRTVDDAHKLRDKLTPGARVVVIGAGFIGAEVASSCRQLGLDVTVVEALPAPLSRVLGDEMGTACGGLHGDHGTKLLCGVGVAEVNHVVKLNDGRSLEADVVIAGIGTQPATGWLAGSPVEVDNGVVCDAGGVTGIPQVVAVGDVARYDGVRAEHWTSATEQAGVAIKNLLAGNTVATHRATGYVWSDQYGVRIQFAGRASGDVRVADGSIADRKFVATYHEDDRMVGVLAMSSARLFTRLRREL